MQQKILLRTAGISEVSEEDWQRGGVYKVNRIHVPLEGRAVYRALAKDTVLSVGNVYILTNSSSFNLKTVRGEGYFHQYLDFQSIPPMITANPTEINLSEDFLARHLLSAVRGIIEQTPDKKISKKDGEEFVKVSKLLEVIILHLRKNYSLAAVQNQKVEEAIRFIEENYARQISNKDISEALFVDLRHLLRLFSNYAAMSPHAYLRQVRIEHAIALLGEGIPVCEVAPLCGYQSESAFRISFKKVTGLAPSLLMKQKRFMI